MSPNFYFTDDTSLLNIKSSIKEINKYVNKDLRSISKFLSILQKRKF